MAASDHLTIEIKRKKELQRQKLLPLSFTIYIDIV